MLWDPKHSFHFHSNKKIDAWQVIVRNMNIDVLAAKQKIGSLFLSFRREKVMIRKNIEKIFILCAQ